MTDALRILAVLALVAGNAFFVIGEYAIVTARRGPIAGQAERGRAGARAALRLMDDPVRVISTVQVGITAIGILTGAVGEPLVRDLLGDGLPRWAGFAIGFAVITYLSVVLGELVPKALTLARAERLADGAGEDADRGDADLHGRDHPDRVVHQPQRRARPRAARLRARDQRRPAGRHDGVLADHEERVAGDERQDGEDPQGVAHEPEPCPTAAPLAHRPATRAAGRSYVIAPVL